MKFNTAKCKAVHSGKKNPRKPSGLISALPKRSWGYHGCQININQHCTHARNTANYLIKISRSIKSRGYYPSPVSTDQARPAVLQPLLQRRVRSRWMWRKWSKSSLWDDQGSGHMACDRGWKTGVVPSSKKGWYFRLKKGWSSANTIREVKDHEVKLVLRVAGTIMKNDNIHKHCLDRFRLDTRKNFLNGRTGQLSTELVMSLNTKPWLTWSLMSASPQLQRGGWMRQLAPAPSNQDLCDSVTLHY